MSKRVLRGSILSLALLWPGAALVAELDRLLCNVSLGPSPVRGDLPLLGTSILLVAALMVTGSFYRRNCRLRATVARSRKRQRDLEEMANTDPGTGVFNRRGMRQMMQREFSRASRERRPLSLMSLDLDRFKTINDAHGHAAGDVVLMEVMHRCRSSLRQVDLVARTGGEEFSIALPGTAREGAVAVAQGIQDRLAEKAIVLPDGSALQITISIGIAQWEEGEELETLMIRADSAMYAAKRDGRNCIRLDRKQPKSLPAPVPAVSDRVTG